MTDLGDESDHTYAEKTEKPFFKAIADMWRDLKKEFAGRGAVDRSVREEVDKGYDKMIKENEEK